MSIRLPLIIALTLMCQGPTASAAQWEFNVVRGPKVSHLLTHCETSDTLVPNGIVQVCFPEEKTELDKLLIRTYDTDLAEFKRIEAMQDLSHSIFRARDQGAEPVLQQIDAIAFTNDVTIPKLVLNTPVPATQLTHSPSDFMRNDLILLPRKKYLNCKADEKCLQKTLHADLAIIQKQITQLEKSPLASLLSEENRKNAREIERLWGNPLSALEVLAGRKDCLNLREFDRSSAIPFDSGTRVPRYSQPETLSDEPAPAPSHAPSASPDAQG